LALKSTVLVGVQLFASVAVHVDASYCHDEPPESVKVPPDAANPGVIERVIVRCAPAEHVWQVLGVVTSSNHVPEGHDEGPPLVLLPPSPAGHDPMSVAHEMPSGQQYE
jgi:hypothetical protein